MKLLIVEDNPQECLLFQQYLQEKPEIELIGFSESSTQALQLIEQENPDAVILDLELQEGSGIQFLAQIQESRMERLPFILVTTCTIHPATLQFVREKGSGFILTKSLQNYSPRFAIDHLLQLEKYFFPAPGNRVFGLPAAELNTAPLLEQIEEKMGKIGIMSGVGHSYLVEAIRHCAEHPRRRIVLKQDVYPHVVKVFRARTDDPAEREKITPANIERDIRAVIEKAWLVGDPEELSKHYTQAIQPGKGNPTVLEFITYFARYYRKK